MIRNPVTLEYLHKAHEQEINKKWSYHYRQTDAAEKQKICVNLGIIKLCI